MSELDVLDARKPVLCLDSRERCTPVVYARMAREGVDTWAQYWMLYDRDYSPLPWRRGHPVDWEMVQYELHDDHTVGLGAYTQHQGGELHDFVAMTGRPYVCVALGKHANYFTPGRHRRSLIDWDVCNAKRELSPDLQPIDTCPPGRHPQWHAPTTWAWSLAGAQGMP